MTVPHRLSGIQKQVHALYRRALRIPRTKPPGTAPKFRLLLSYTFHKNASACSPRDFSTIEYMLRQGTKQIEMYENPSIRDVFLSKEVRRWGEERGVGKDGVGIRVVGAKTEAQEQL